MHVLDTPQQVRIEHGHAVPVRPTRQLSRRDTQREAQANAQIFRDRFCEGPFADVPERRAYGAFGPRVMTGAHVQLIDRLRLEGARFCQEAVEAKREAKLIHQRHQATWDRMHAYRDEAHALREQLTEVQAQLEQAKEDFAHVETLITAFGDKRNSRHQRRSSVVQAPLFDDADRAKTPDLHPLQGS